MGLHTRTTQLYDRGSEDVTLDEVERILIWRESELLPHKAAQLVEYAGGFRAKQ